MTISRSIVRFPSMSRIFILSLLLIAFCQSCRTQPVSKLAVNAPTIDQEATSIWRTINDINFLEGQGYTVHLPEVALLDSLQAKSKEGAFGNQDFPTIYNLLEQTVYDEANYQLALAKVKAQEELLNTLLQRLRAASKTWNWDFKLLETYDVIFTLYGTGGSYDPDNGRVVLFTTLQGDFMNYEQPANTIIHEIVHLGVETSLVQRYQLSHPMKERLVDTIVYLLFNDLLPQYKVQNMGETRLDQYLSTPEDLVDLEASIKKIVNGK